MARFPLIRSGWMNVMVPMMVEILADLKTGESEEQLRALVEEFVWRLTGKETIYQMIAFAEAIEARGGKPLEPLAYKQDVSRPALGERSKTASRPCEKAKLIRKNIWYLVRARYWND